MLLNANELDFFDGNLHSQLSGAFSGLLAAAIEKMDGIGGRPGWAWIFILVRFFGYFTIDLRSSNPLI